jgi:hypothetical protein
VFHPFFLVLVFISTTSGEPVRLDSPEVSGLKSYHTKEACQKVLMVEAKRAIEHGLIPFETFGIACIQDIELEQKNQRRWV